MLYLLHLRRLSFLYVTTPTHGDRNHSMTYTIKVRAPLLTLSKQTQHVHSKRPISYASSKFTYPRTHIHPQHLVFPPLSSKSTRRGTFTNHPQAPTTKHEKHTTQKKKKRSQKMMDPDKFSFAASSKVSRFYDTSKPSISSCQHASSPLSLLVFSLLSFPFIQQITPLAKKASRHDISPPTPGSTAR